VKNVKIKYKIKNFLILNYNFACPPFSLRQQAMVGGRSKTGGHFEF